MFKKSCDDEFMAIAGSDVKSSVSVLVFTVNLGSYEHMKSFQKFFKNKKYIENHVYSVQEPVKVAAA